MVVRCHSSAVALTFNRDYSTLITVTFFNISVCVFISQCFIFSSTLPRPPSSCQVTMWSPARLGLIRRQGYQAGFQPSRAVRNVYTGNVWSKLRRSVVVFPSHFELGFFAPWIGRSEMEFATLVLLLRNKPRNGQSRHNSCFARWSSHSWSLGRLWSGVLPCAL